MNVDRNSTIGGQSIKVVRALLRDIDNGASITTDYVASFIRQQIWLDHINDLVKQDKLDRSQRDAALRFPLSNCSPSSLAN